MKKIIIILALMLLPLMSFAEQQQQQQQKQEQYKIDVSVCPVEQTKGELKIFEKECTHKTAFYYAGRGCCSRHGGQCGCDFTGRVRCCDGTLSPTCKC